jgi:PhnB protein
MAKVDPIPKGYHTITPALTVKDARAAIEFYKKAFGAEEREICLGPDGKKVMHAEIKIGDTIVMLGEEFPQMGCIAPKTLGGSPVALQLYVENADAWFEKATKAGAKVVMPLQDQFWGDRHGAIEDLDGHKWGISTHIKDLTKEEITKGMEEWAKKQMAHAK